MEENLVLLVGRRQAAQALGISVRTLDSLVSRNELRARRVQRRVLFEPRELERFARRDHLSQRVGDRENK